VSHTFMFSSFRICAVQPCVSVWPLLSLQFTISTYYKEKPDQINASSLTVSCVLLNRGIPTVPGSVCLKKDANNLIGISIGGGAQYCPCLYIVQVRTEQFELNTSVKCTMSEHTVFLCGWCLF